MTGACDVLHVDMDAFFASAEVLDDPALAGRPVVVGGLGPRGVVASCSYEARCSGVRSAMPMATARRLCPDAAFLTGRYHVYAALSRRLHAVLAAFSPSVEGIGLDEAFVEVSGAHRLFGTSAEIAQRVRAQVSEDLGMACSIGVGRTKLVAKLASRSAKPRARPDGPRPGPGVVVVPPGEELAFLRPLPVAALPGVGPATLESLSRMGVTTVGDLSRVPVASLRAPFGRTAAARLHELSHGRDPRSVEAERAVKSIGHEETFPADVVDPATLGRQVLRLADAVGSRLREAGRAGRTVTLKVRFSDFSTLTRSETLARPVDAGAVIARTSRALLGSLPPGRGVRLLGVGVSGLVASEGPGAELQLRLAGSGSDAAPWDEAAAAVDAVRARYGADAVAPAALIGRHGVEVKRRGESQWGPSKAAPPTPWALSAPEDGAKM